MRSRGISVSQIFPWIAWPRSVTGGIGALVYEPEAAVPIEYGHVDLDDVAFQVRQFLQGSPIEVINRLLALNGSSAGRDRRH